MKPRTLIFKAPLLVSLFSFLVIPTLSELQTSRDLRSSGTIVIFGTSFEEGTLTPRGRIYWEITEPGNVTLTDEIAHSGGYSAKIYSAEGGPDGRVPAVYIDEWPWNRTTLHERIHFMIEEWHGYIVAITFRNTHATFNDQEDRGYHLSEAVIWEDYVKVSRYITNQSNPQGHPIRATGTYNYSVQIQTGKWYYLELGVENVGTENTLFRLWFAEIGQNPELVIQITGDTTWTGLINNGTAYGQPYINKFYGGIQIYSQAGAVNGPAVMFLDDLAIAESHIGPKAAPVQ